jgi:SAM-dependent methyltransferase
VGDFKAEFCGSCGHFFNAAFDEGRIGYTQTYENSLHFSPRFVQFSNELVDRLSRSYTLSGKTVVDIGCGKGDFLKRLCAISGARGIGFDKSFEEDRGETSDNLLFVRDWFSDAYPDVRPDFVSCRHVLEHINEPIDFLRTLRSHPGISPETVMYFEVPNALYTLRDLGIWDLIYEHVSYFTPDSLRAAFELAGFDVLAIGSSFGEQYLYIEAKPARQAPVRTSTAAATLRTLVDDFGRAYADKVSRWNGFLAQNDPAHVAVWGAGSKGVTFVNALQAGPNIAALVDVSPYKQGRFAPRTGTAVLAPEQLTSLSIRSLIVMNPLYRDEIKAATEALGLTPAILVA